MGMILPAVIEGDNPWQVPILFATIVMGVDVLPAASTPTFDLGVVVVGFAVHFALSILFGVALAAILYRVNLVIVAALIGIAFGIALYFINFYAFTNIFFPWFAIARGGGTIVAHILFGLIAALIYGGFRRARA
jgi:hypothetical protein